MNYGDIVFFSVPTRRNKYHVVKIDFSLKWICVEAQIVYHTLSILWETPSVKKYIPQAICFPVKISVEELYHRIKRE